MKKLKTSADYKETAMEIAKKLKERFGIKEALPEIGIVLGTGWGGKVNFTVKDTVKLNTIPEFNSLNDLTGHERSYKYGFIDDKIRVLALDGRIHLNESFGNRDVPSIVRLQIEVMIAIGVKKLILTCAAGSLPNSGLNPDDIMVIDSFVTLFAPDMPLVGGEFISPEDSLQFYADTFKFTLEGKVVVKGFRNNVGFGTYAMLRGPFFEGRKHDKQALVDAGADAVGMSMLPEACIASIYGVNVLGLAFITNGSTEVHSHEHNLSRAKASDADLSKFLTECIYVVNSTNENKPV